MSFVLVKQKLKLIFKKEINCEYETQIKKQKELNPLYLSHPLFGLVCAVFYYISFHLCSIRIRKGHSCKFSYIFIFLLMKENLKNVILNTSFIMCLMCKISFNYCFVGWRRLVLFFFCNVCFKRVLKWRRLVLLILKIH